ARRASRRLVEAEVTAEGARACSPEAPAREELGDSIDERLGDLLALLDHRARAKTSSNSAALEPNLERRRVDSIAQGRVELARPQRVVQQGLELGLSPLGQELGTR